MPVVTRRAFLSFFAIPIFLQSEDASSQDVSRSEAAMSWETQFGDSVLSWTGDDGSEREICWGL
jgi:hypothetical protein